MGAASEYGSALGSLRLPVALAFFLFSFQAAYFFCLAASHSGWLCGKGIYIPPFHLLYLRPCYVQNTFLTPPTVLNFPTFSNFHISSPGRPSPGAPGVLDNLGLFLSRSFFRAVTREMIVAPMESALSQ